MRADETPAAARQSTRMNRAGFVLSSVQRHFADFLGLIRILRKSAAEVLLRVMSASCRHCEGVLVQRGASERLVLKYSPHWSGAGERMHPIDVPACYTASGFELVHHEERKLKVPFTRESWNGRMKACRGIGASLDPEHIAAWEREHMAMLERIAPERFDVLHYAASAELKRV